MKVLYITLIIILLNAILLPANSNKEGLLKILPQKQGKEKIDCLNQISKIIREDNPQEAREYIYEAIKLSKDIGYYQGEGQALLNLGVTESVLGNNNEAEHNFNQALNLYQHHSDIIGIIKSKIDLCHVQTMMGNYKNALMNVTQAYNLSKEYHFSDEKALSSLNLGLLYEEIYEYNKALEFLNIAYELQKKSGNRKNLVKTLNMIGIIYLNINKTDKSLITFYEALKYIDTINNVGLTETIYNNIALIYSKQGDNEKALNFFYRSLHLSEKIQDSVSIAISLNNLGNEYGELGNFNEAKYFLNKSIEILNNSDAPNDLAAAYLVRGRFFIKNKLQKNAQYDLLIALDIYNKLNIMDGKREIYGLLSESYILSNNNTLASQSLLKYKNINDSLHIIERTKSIDITNAKIAALTQIEKLDSELKIEKEKNLKVLFIFLSLFIFFVMTIINFLARKRLIGKLYQNEIQLDYFKKNNQNLYDSFATDVKDSMFMLGNTILESNDSKNFRILKSKYDDVAHVITNVLVKYKVDTN